MLFNPIELLLKIDDGTIKLLESEPTGDKRYFGYPTWTLEFPDGDCVETWVICVFDDAGEWDYIEWMKVTRKNNQTGEIAEEAEWSFSTSNDYPDDETKFITEYVPKNLAQWSY